MDKVSFREKINTDSPMVLYELIPPPANAPQSAIIGYVDCISQLLDNVSIPIDAVNVPEIHAENGNGGDRTHEYKSKIDPRQFASYINQYAKRDIEIVVNHCTVDYDHKGQQAWLCETREKYNLENIVLVGGESSKIAYPGLSVNEMSQLIQRDYENEFLCGGITIPTRRKSLQQHDEPHRLLMKSQDGIEFFTSQVLYDVYTIQKLLKDYDDLCVQKDIAPRRIFLSFAPVSSRKDIQFLKWLGVVIPQATEEKLLQADLGIGWRSIQVVQDILIEVLEFIRNERLKVPIGLNIEHITQHNFEITKELVDRVGETYYQHYLSKENVS